MDLGRELETYRRELPRLPEAGREGHFALIRSDAVDSVWQTKQEAYEAGCPRFGLEALLVQQVRRTEPVIYSVVDVIP